MYMLTLISAAALQSGYGGGASGADDTCGEAPS
jgi:hypothetical protein